MIKISFGLSNYDKPTPKRLKAVADTLLALMLVLDPLVLSMPDFPHKQWALLGWNSLVVLFKFFTKYTAIKIP